MGCEGYGGDTLGQGVCWGLSCGLCGTCVEAQGSLQQWPSPPLQNITMSLKSSVCEIFSVML